MSDFIQGGLSSNVDVTAIVISDTHWRSVSDPLSTRCGLNLPIIKAAMQAQPAYDIILHPGDIINEIAGVAMQDAFEADFTQPFYKCRGNHDYHATNAELGIPAPGYYVQDIGTVWRLIVLDSTEDGTQINSGTYKLGAVQKAWFADELDNAVTDGKFVIIMLHVPVAGFAAMKYFVRNAALDPVVSASFNATKDMMMDQYTICEQLRNYPNVKIVLAGHEHLFDNVEDRGVTHLIAGAVSGNFWQSPMPKFGENPGYARLTFFKDGAFNFAKLYYNYVE